MYRQMTARLFKSKPNRGFTLVEIIIALALGGLVSLLVFYALRQAQYTARDGLRRKYVQKVAENLDIYKDSAANQFQYPTTAIFASKFIASGQAYFVPGNDPSTGANFTAAVLASGAIPAYGSYGLGVLIYQPGYACGVNGGTANSGVYRIYTKLEENNTMYCVDNH